ncbi:unnamed protein product [Citrullus colocynthis]|uniref:Uncharacterized protein n=1 Tax=Citrullus colocynthis TaxID=252529 RepID=A0ABP0Y3A2_9ROSI
MEVEKEEHNKMEQEFDMVRENVRLVNIEEQTKLRPLQRRKKGYWKANKVWDGSNMEVSLVELTKGKEKLAEEVWMECQVDALVRKKQRTEENDLISIVSVEA